MNNEKLHLTLERLQKAVDFLDKVLKTPKDDVQRAAAIQAFEMSFELSWRVMKVWLEIQGVISISPREAIREAARLGLIDDAPMWLDYLNIRNLSSHTYNEANAVEAYTVIESSFASAVRGLLLRSASQD